MRSNVRAGEFVFLIMKQNVFPTASDRMQLQSA